MNIQDVENLAELARLELPAEEKEKLLSDMESILGYIRQINELQVEDTKEDYNLYNIWRPDIPELEEFSAGLIKKQFSDSQDGFLKVKKIL